MINRFQELLHTPEGVFDHYGRDAAEYDEIAGQIRRTFESYGYEQLKTPTFEFFDVFSREIGTTPSRELYKFFDKEGNTLVLRPDFTPPVARCAAKYYMDETGPIRFYYQGSTFTNTSNLQGKRKEFMQTGVELVGEPSVYADAEMLALLMESLLSSGLRKFQITVGNVEYFKGICDAAGLDETQEQQLRELISGKNYYAAESLLDRIGVSESEQDQFFRLTSFMRSDEDLRKAALGTPNVRAREAVERLCAVYAILKQYGLSEYVSFDLSLLSKYQYYTGVIFKGYTYGVGEAVATGGRYDTLLAHFGKNAAATGFMIQLDTLTSALRTQHIPIPVPEEAQKVAYTEDSFAQALARAQEIRRSGGKAVLVRE